MKKSGSNQLSLATASILGQPPSQLIAQKKYVGTAEVSDAR